jgi:hypothetical protein
MCKKYERSIPSTVNVRSESPEAMVASAVGGTVAVGLGACAQLDRTSPARIHTLMPGSKLFIVLPSEKSILD